MYDRLLTFFATASSSPFLSEKDESCYLWDNTINDKTPNNINDYQAVSHKLGFIMKKLDICIHRDFPDTARVAILLVYHFVCSNSQ